MTISTTEGTRFTLSNDNDSSNLNILVIAFFDSSDNKLSRNVMNTGAKYLTAVAPANTAYVIACFHDWSLVSNAQLETGTSTPTAYAPYSNERPITGHTSASVVGTGNLINEATNVVGKYINTSGAVVNTAYYQYTDLIPVTVGKTYKLQVKNTATGIAYATARAVSAYDENGTFIDRIASASVTVANQGKPASVEVTIPSGVTHVRLNYCVGDIGCAFSNQYYSNTVSWE